MKCLRRLKLFLLFFISLIYMEFVYHILIYGKIFQVSNFHMIIYLSLVSSILALICGLFNRKANKTIFFIIFSCITVWFNAQYVVKSFFDFNISFSILQIADQLNSFALKTILEVVKRILQIGILSLPLILTIIFRKRVSFNKFNRNKILKSLLICLLLRGGYLLSLNIGKKADYSPYVLYYDINNPQLNIERMGIINTLCVDTNRTIYGFNEKIVTVKKKQKKEKKPEYKYNNLDIDFETLKNDNQNVNIQNLTEYFSNEIGTLQNQYTGKFKGKNLILFMAESFNEIAVTQETTPTLYKLVNNGFVFNNYYTPTIFSTIGGEFQELTGLYANFSSLTTFRNGVDSFPMGIATLFKESGYNTFAYHDNSFSFQDRNVYLKSLGFENFKACYNGLETLINCKAWPQSDVEMIEQTYNDYINSENPFMVFYASVSGHSSYNFTSNAMAKKHKDEIMAQNYGYSTPTLAYMAAQMEFDQALELLINKLEEAGKLEDTVIIFVGDHYPYELTVDQVNEAASYQKDDVIEINHSNLAIWNSAMENVNIDKVGSQIDVLPTIYNLFALPYDSRLIIGNDILSTEPGLAMFANNSWVSDKGKYFAATGEFVPTVENIADDYVSLMNQDVQNRIIISKLIISENYYNTVWNYKK